MRTCSVKIPRWIGYRKEVIHVSLQGFGDASEKAYAGVVYIRILRLDGSVSCRLLAAKTKVAPLKKTSIPRLELKAAVLLTSLMSTLKAALKIPGIQQQAWTVGKVSKKIIYGGTDQVFYLKSKIIGRHGKPL